MNRRKYSAYRGRRSNGRRLLIALIVLLTIALVGAVVWFYIIPNHTVYSDKGAQVVFSSPGAEKDPASPERPGEGVVIVETPTPTPAPELPEFDLSLFPRRSVPLGLVTVDFSRLGEDALDALGESQGAVFDVTGFDAGEEGMDYLEAVRELPYAVAWLSPKWSDLGPDGAFSADLARSCLNLAATGFDEILLSAPADSLLTGEMELPGCLTLCRNALGDCGFQGRLSMVVRRSWFTNEELKGLLPTLAENLDRVYAASQDSWAGLNLYAQLKGLGFLGSTADIVTQVGRPASVNWSWAVLP